MKQKLIKLFTLFIVMSVLTSSSNDSGSSMASPAAKSDCVTAGSCRESATVAEKTDDARLVSLADNEISLSPISRFILVQ